jgi:hypothetical protein
MKLLTSLASNKNFSIVKFTMQKFLSVATNINTFLSKIQFQL